MIDNSATINQNKIDFLKIHRKNILVRCETDDPVEKANTTWPSITTTTMSAIATSAALINISPDRP